MTDIEDIIGEAQLPQRTVTICVRGDLVARWEELHEQWRTAPDKAESLASAGPKAALAAQLRELQEEMAAASRIFVFQALPPADYSALISQHPPKTGTQGRFNAESLRGPLVSACAVNPTMTLDQVARLFAKLSEGQARELGDAAYLANEGGVDIPFDGAVYAETMDTDSA